MTYILMIWTLVGYAGTQSSVHTKYDWRPIGEFQADGGVNRCEEAARQLGLKMENYRCVRSK